MSTDDISSIQQQKTDVFQGTSFVKLTESCVVGNGIVQLSSKEEAHYMEVFDSIVEPLVFFVPASGSGSRMFAELTHFVETGEETAAIKSFFEHFPETGIFYELPQTVKEKTVNLQSIYLASYLISKDGMNLPAQPKGLIPFHVLGDRCYNPFQEQVQQACELLGQEGRIHFTVQAEHEEKIIQSIRSLGKPHFSKMVTFSYQDPSSNATCFDAKGDLVMFENEVLKRPAGHGALLRNLNAIDEDLVLIKNIDNVQHWAKSDMNKRVWKYCTGFLIEFKKELKQLSENFSKAELKRLNAKYQFLSDQEEKQCGADRIVELASRPSRVCGMVLNEGAPGGGPFWIDDAGTISKQIVEKVQIDPVDIAIVEESSHFNPVFIALSKSDVHGNTLDLERFVDHSKYIIARKPHGKDEIVYRELPGLWNGSMHHWNSIFVEIPKEVFSPVKSVFDLNNDAHKV